MGQPDELRRHRLRYHCRRSRHHRGRHGAFVGRIYTFVGQAGTRQSAHGRPPHGEGGGEHDALGFLRPGHHPSCLHADPFLSGRERQDVSAYGLHLRLCAAWRHRALSYLCAGRDLAAQWPPRQRLGMAAEGGERYRAVEPLDHAPGLPLLPAGPAALAAP